MFGLNDNSQTNNQPVPPPAGLPPSPFADPAKPADPEPIFAPTAPDPALDLPPLPKDPLAGGPPAIIPEHPSKPSAQPTAPAPSEPPSQPAGNGSPAPADNDLLDLKEQALHSLSPLVDKLDQSPEEKFKTTMMLIQASDNAGLVKEAYEAANAIPDEKARAQALLDVVNEINYFTQHHEDA